MGMSIFWLAALVVFGVVEAATVGLVSIWFAMGALAALIASALGVPDLVQVVVFLVGSFATLLVVRPLAQKYVNNRHIPTNADRVIGQEAVVTEAIDNLKGQGQVKVAGTPWTARSGDDAAIPAGTTVRVLRIEGVKLYVTPTDAVSTAEE